MKKTKTAIYRNLYLLLSGMGVGWLAGLSVSPIIHIILTSLMAAVVSVTSALAGLNSGKVEEVEPSEDESNHLQPETRKPKFQVQVNPLPVTCMIVGLAIGSSAGVFVRTNNWLGPRSNTITEEWKDTELSKKEIARRVFDNLYPPSSITSSPPEAPGDKKIEQGVTTGQKVEPANTSSSDNIGSTTSQPQIKQAQPDTIPNSYKDGVLFTVDMKECDRLKNADGDELRREMASSGNDEIVRWAKNCQDTECLKAVVRRACAKYK